MLLQSLFSFTRRFAIMPLLSSSGGHPPSQHVVDDAGRRWRLCAGAAVLNSRNELLIGERIGKKNSWQAPQGGVDATVGDDGVMETVSDAASRELYEEVGLETGKHVLREKMNSGSAPIKCRYTTEGTGSWLEKAGYSGQELNWTLFRCADSNLECDPSSVCTLTGLNGESAEFNAVKWMSLDWVIENVWEAKRGPYETLRDGCVQAMKDWHTRCSTIDLNGKWSRDSIRSSGLVEALTARGVNEEKAIACSAEPYMQLWQRLDVDQREFKVFTYDKDTEKVRRELIYPLGKFTETYEGNSMLFGASKEGSIERQCFYLAEKDADGEIAHVTISETPQ
jgi:8-oxo-dGTP pyrophosphatase MutT (NUDIX family)